MAKQPWQRRIALPGEAFSMTSGGAVNHLSTRPEQFRPDLSFIMQTDDGTEKD
jgi:hypothetical protein